MKNLVVYYSWTGNTEVAAKEIHKLIGGDLMKIEEVKERKPGLGFAGAGFSAFMGLKGRLKEMDFSFKDYENIFLCSQVWASRSTPAINALLSKADFKNKKVYLFLTKADDKVPQKVIDSITKRIEKRGGKVVSSSSITTQMGTIIKPEDVTSPISEWIRKVNIV